MDIEKIKKICDSLPTRVLLRAEYGCGGNQHGCTQPIVVNDDVWDTIDNPDFNGLDESDIYLSWHSQNEFYMNEPDQVIGYIKCYTVYDLLDCCGDWQSGITPDCQELQHGLHVVWSDDGKIDEWKITNATELIDYMLDNWDFSDLQKGYEDDVRTFLVKKWLR